MKVDSLHISFIFTSYTWSDIKARVGVIIIKSVAHTLCVKGVSRHPLNKLANGWSLTIVIGFMYYITKSNIVHAPSVQ